MILRALFWISLVWLLMPREPDLGFGRPGALEMPHRLAALASETSGRAMAICGERESFCQASTDFLESFRGLVIRNLVRVKSDIETAQRLRARNG